MSDNTSILLVEDDPSMGFLLVDFLESNRFEVVLCVNGRDGLAAFQSRSFHFCILDVMMPEMDGFTLAENIRARNKTVPIIFLTARTLKVDKIKGFNLGVDDYVTKPFDEDELLCRIRAILNRTGQPTVSETDSVHSIGSFRFDADNQLLVINEVSRRLTQKENEVLKYLCRHKNQVVRRDDLLGAVWGKIDYFNGRSMDVFITKLRKYLQDDPRVNIENIPKVGFVLNC
ncbi:MAG: response regulator transcription factor [Marinilabiliaceae bacterium]|nr:response regulator transcription factor [Marinilabiliaceae bacterium]